MSEKIITLKPDNKSQFWWYLAGFMLIPLFGLGLYLIYRVYKNHQAISYTVTDRQIMAEDLHISENIDLANITDVEIEQRWIDKKFGIGNLTLITKNRELKLIGLENPAQLSNMILKAAEAERKRLQNIKKQATRAKENTKPGSIDKMNYLTGLWQQGLISNEDFENEKKHFED